MSPVRLDVAILVILCLKACIASDVKSITLPRTFNAMQEGWLNVNHPMIYFDPATYSTMVSTLVQLPGLKSVRVPVHWAALEPTQNQTSASYLARLDAAFDAFNASSVNVVLFFVGSPSWITSDTTNQNDGYPPLSNYPYIDRAVWLAKRYQNKGLEAIQVWNEVNLPSFWGPAENPQAYYNFYTQTCAAIRGNVSSVTCLYAGMAYYSQMPNYGGQFMFVALQQLGGISGIPAAIYHPYFQRPEGDDGDGNLHDFLDGASYLNSQLKAAGASKVWAGETGWSTYTGTVVEQPLITEDQQADYLVRRFILLAATGFDRIFLFSAYDFPDGLTGSARDEKYGIIDTTGRKKPAFGAIQYYLKNFFMGTTQSLSPCTVDNSSLTPSNSSIYAVTMTVNATTSARHVVFIWSPSGYQGSLAVTCNSIVSGYLSTGPILGTVIDIVRHTVVTTTPVSSNGSFNMQLGSSVRAVVFSNAPSPTSSSTSTPQQGIPTGANGSPKTNSSSAKNGGCLVSLVVLSLMLAIIM